MAQGAVGLHVADSVTFAALRPDTIVSQAVIQHFPSLGYADRFLAGVEASGAKWLMLQTRDGKP